LPDIDTAVKLKPNDALYMLILAYTQEMLNQLDQAKLNYDRAISINNHFAAAYFARGNFITKHSNPQDALADYQKSVEIDPIYAPALVSLARLYRSQTNFETAFT